MKVFTFLLFVFSHFYSFSQSLEEREKITAEFIKQSDIEIELFNINSVPKLDSIRMKFNYLKRKNIDCEILGFRISGIDKNEEILFSKWFKDNIISSEFNKKIADCSKCIKVKIDRITIKWFTGTYTLKSNDTWSIK